MKKLHSVLKEIMEITTTMETEYPELYQFLEEDPMTIPTSGHPNVDEAALREYLKSLKGMLQHHRSTRKKS
ncbi:MAG: hypothetical protein KJO53_03640 [Eudoraea sp.]|nr:hypothetical protein [Eudoraea sp.]MBT8293967.1 hypothetical protein [Eudoraea sp.]